MPFSLVDADSLLSIDVGTISTRAALFDVVEGRYRYIASGQAASTAGVPYRDISEGVRQAIESLEALTGRVLLNESHQLILPSTQGFGIDAVAATYSAGPALKTVVVGLLNDVSLESLQRLARSTYARVVDTIGMNDTRPVEEQIDSLVRNSPDLVLIAGGTDEGATRSVQLLLETVGLACHLLPAEKLPAVLYAGNRRLSEQVRSSLQPLTSSLAVSANLHPTLEVEDLQPAQYALAGLYNQIRRMQMNGVDELNNWAGNTLVPTAYAEGRIIRFLSQGYDPGKGLLGVDLGASAATLAAGFNGSLAMGVYPQLGMGDGLAGLLRYTNLEDITRWLTLEIPDESVREYIQNKALFPATLPATQEELSIEHAIARQNLLIGLNSLAKDFPRSARRMAPGLTPFFEPILASGSTLTRAPGVAQTLLILLDAIQPVGITTIVTDPNSLLPGLGAAASRNALLPVQVLESGAFQLLATVIAPHTAARAGTPVLRARLVLANGNESRAEIKQGSLELLPLVPGQSGRLYLQLLHGADVGFGPGRTPKDGLPVSGTALGLVFDARGRPLRLPADGGRRRELLKKWQQGLGG